MFGTRSCSFLILSLILVLLTWDQDQFFQQHNRNFMDVCVIFLNWMELKERDLVTLSAILLGWVAQPRLARILQGTASWNCISFSISAEVFGKLMRWDNTGGWFIGSSPPPCTDQQPGNRFSFWIKIEIKPNYNRYKFLPDYLRISLDQYLFLSWVQGSSQNNLKNHYCHREGNLNRRIELVLWFQFFHHSQPLISLTTYQN